MRQLIISNYDSSTNFTYVVIDNGEAVERCDNPKDSTKYGLYDDSWGMLDNSAIDFNKNKAIQEFDMIILCEDGDIDIYRKEEDKNDTI